MLVDPELLSRARKDDATAVVEVISMQYASSFRMAHALAGRADVGDGIVQFVMRRSFKALSSWNDEDAPQRWFRHHTILTARRTAARRQPTSAADTLVYTSGTPADPAYAAFVLALRGLPCQQREAFLLHHGEKLELRALATGMDCSTVAAAQHLETATARLRELGGANYDALVARLADAYLKLAPASDLVLSRVSRSVRKMLWPRKLARFIGAVLMMCILFALAFIAVKWWRDILVWFKDVLSH